MELSLAEACAFWGALCAIGFAWERHTRPCAVCNDGTSTHRMRVLDDYDNETLVGVCADCYTLTHTMESTHV